MSLLTDDPHATLLDHDPETPHEPLQKTMAHRGIFQILKTGCAVEKRGARSRHSLLNTVAMLVPIAWRLLVLRAAERFAPASPATGIVDEVELAALRQLVPKARLPKRPTAHRVLLAIAAVGGHLKHNGPPGWLVLGRGMEDLLRFSAGFRAAMKLMEQAGASEM